MAGDYQTKPVFVIRVPIKLITDREDRDQLRNALIELSDKLSVDYYTILLTDNSISRIEFEAHNANVSKIDLAKLEQKLLTEFNERLNA
jgi:hypothetical protein